VITGRRTVVAMSLGVSCLRDRGQASVETVALVPAVAALAVLAWQALLVGWTAVSAERAARAGARAVLAGERPTDVEDAVRASLPATMRDAEVDLGRDRVVLTVRVPALVPGVAPTLTAAAAVVRQ
jgi:hypothetical protein